MPLLHLIVFMLVSLVVLVALVQGALALRRNQPSLVLLTALSLAIVVAGISVAGIGGPPWPVYSAVVALLLPPIVYRMKGTELVQYEVLATLSSPAIHLIFSFLFGWREYLPFWRVPAAWELLSTL